ncbi:MAG: hypothetical protein JWO35_686 [Candidatus Saccharibacteria bacterium]|nr:hypothetical protein [Candidatus Saccharibacteria bacterium]
MSVEVGLITAVSMLLANAFFVGAEFGLVSARRSNIELLALNGSRAAKITLDAMEHVSLMLAGAQLGVTLCTLIFGAVAEPLIAALLESPLHELGVSQALLHPLSFVIALILMVYVHVVIGEMVPKNLALANPTRAAIALTPPLVLIVTIIKPLVLALNIAANACLKALGIKASNEIASSFSRDEVAGFVKESHREGLLSKDEEHLLSGALRFDERTVQSVLLPLDNVVCASTNLTPEEIEGLTVKTGFSRFPVKNNRGRLTGYVHLKDILEIADAAHQEPVPQRFIRPLASVKSSTSLRTALVAMQRSGAHLAQVVNAKQAVVGIIALEDVLEELVGEIRDDSQKQ